MLQSMSLVLPMNWHTINFSSPPSHTPCFPPPPSSPVSPLLLPLFSLSVSVLPGTSGEELVSCGEDASFRVWKGEHLSPYTSSTAQIIIHALLRSLWMLRMHVGHFILPVLYMYVPVTCRCYNYTLYTFYITVLHVLTLLSSSCV